MKFCPAIFFVRLHNLNYRDTLNYIYKIRKLSFFAFLCLCVNSLQGEFNDTDSHQEQSELFALPSTNTIGLEPRLKRFLDKFYQENYPEEAMLKSTQSIQLIGTYTINDQPEGQLKIIKKRPNKYKSKIKSKYGSELITIFNGSNLYTGARSDEDKPYIWSQLDTNSPENSWIHFDQHFDSSILSPLDPNKEMELLKAYREDQTLIQPLKIKHKTGYTVTHHVDVSNNLILFTEIELHEPMHSNYNKYEVHYESYKKVHGIQFPMVVVSKVSPELTIRNEFSEIKTNLGISNFIFEPNDL